jgi:hypothetical protein
MKNIILIALPLWAIASVLFAINSKIPNNLPVPKTSQVTEKVVPVIGRTTIVFDGLGASMGFLVEDEDGLRVLPYDSESMATNEDFEPEYLSVVTFDNGQTHYQPLVVNKF